MTEALHALFRKAEDGGELMGVTLFPASPWVSHLLFVDDSLVFYRATVSECVKIQGILFQYEQALGQSINRGKTSFFFFSSNTVVQTQEAIKYFIGILAVQRCKQTLKLDG